MRRRFLTALFLEFFLQATNLLALQTYPLINQQQTTIKVSKSELNRIAVQDDRIQQIFGAEEAFDVQSDDNSGQIFIRLLDTRKSKPTTLTLITESGLTHDLTLVSADLPFQSILLKPGELAEAPESAPTKPIEHFEQLIQAMRAGKPYAGYKLIKLSSPDRSTPEPLKITPHVLYQGSTFEGRFYTLENTGDMALPLSEEIFALPQDRALSLSTNNLEPGEHGVLLVISQKGSQA